MKTSPVNQSGYATKAKNILSKTGTIAGLGIGGVYVAKNYNDLFVKSAEQAVRELGNKNKGLAVASVVAVGAVGLCSVVGKTAGKAIGSLIDKHRAEKNPELQEKPIKKNVFKNLILIAGTTIVSVLAGKKIGK